MNIRAITIFADPGWPLREEVIARASRFAREAKEAFEAGGFSVQTIRLATPPFPDLLGPDHAAQAVQLAQEIEAAGFVGDIEYISLGPARPSHAAAFVEVIPDMIAATQNVFLSIMVAEVGHGVSLLAVRQSAQAVQRIVAAGGDGSASLRFAALACVPPGTPFMPAAYFGGGPAGFALATESADLLVGAVEVAHTLAEVRSQIVQSVEEAARRCAAIAKNIGAAAKFRFFGIDFSPAPFPEQARSLGHAVERLGVSKAGWHGTLAAAAFLADALDRAEFPRAGFCGLFMPVLEDVVLAARAGEGALTVADLLLYSAVCGAGLDTIPLPGDITADELAAIILDTAALALRLNKPLSARLMPVPGKVAGDEVRWDFRYFAPGRVLAYRSGPLAGLLAGVESFELAERNAR